MIAYLEYVEAILGGGIAVYITERQRRELDLLLLPAENILHVLIPIVR